MPWLFNYAFFFHRARSIFFLFLPDSTYFWNHAFSSLYIFFPVYRILHRSREVKKAPSSFTFPFPVGAIAWALFSSFNYSHPDYVPEVMGFYSGSRSGWRVLLFTNKFLYSLKSIRRRVSRVRGVIKFGVREPLLYPSTVSVSLHETWISFFFFTVPISLWLFDRALMKRKNITATLPFFYFSSKKHQFYILKIASKI